MGTDRTTCCLFALFRSSIILLSFDVPANTRPRLLYPWRGISSRYVVRPAAPKMYPSTPTYKLDAWSQYDNPEEGNDREGDIRHFPLSRKTSTTDEQLLWPDGVVPYFVDETIVNEPTKLAMLEDAMANIMEQTCVKFVRIYPNDRGELPDHTWVNITGAGRGCFADLGRCSFAPTLLNLDIRKCFRTRGHALHEILHTLGVFHEHMRPDRDQFIKILWNNVKEGNDFNFEIMEDNAVTTFGLPYDYDSIMHYSMTAFSKNKSIPTIVPRKVGAEIGQRSHLSATDVEKLLIAYKCKNFNAKYSAKLANQDKSNEAKLSNLGATIPPASSEDLVRSIHPLQDYFSKPFHPKPKYQKFLPMICDPSYEFCYPKYYPNPSAIDSYRYHYDDV